MYYGHNKPTRNTHLLRVSKHQLGHVLRTGLTQTCDIAEILAAT